ncbi:MAG: hypothetical protein K8E24_009080 [Methanobacterium paludis]|nr:hypothetical protein [Methanobacterium paludis]
MILPPVFSIFSTWPVGLWNDLQNYFKTFHIFHTTYWNMVFGLERGEAMEDEEGIRTIQRFGENVANLIKKIN